MEPTVLEVLDAFEFIVTAISGHCTLGRIPVEEYDALRARLRIVRDAYIIAAFGVVSDNTNQK